MMVLRDYQEECLRNIVSEYDAGVQRQLIVLATGCHRIGTQILMFNGEPKAVELIIPGDLVMGMDGLPRRVMSLCRGVDSMYRIQPKKGDEFFVNGNHLLTLVQTNTKKDSDSSSTIVDVTVSEYLEWGKTAKHIHKLFRVPVSTWIEKNLPIDPYFLGVILGDGSIGKKGLCIHKPDEEILQLCQEQAKKYGMDIRIEQSEGKYGSCTSYHFTNDYKRNNPLIRVLTELGLYDKNSGNKFIPFQYKTGSVEQRREVLAGLLDTDGSLAHNGYDFISKSRQLSEDVCFVARSLGFAAYLNPCIKSCQTGSSGEYFRVCISGNSSDIPCRLPRKKGKPREQKKSVLRTGFTVTKVSDAEDYYGFTLDGDGRYLLADFTVTHNSGKTVIFSHIPQLFPGKKVLVLAHRKELLTQAYKKLHKANPSLHIDIEKAELFASEWSDIVIASVPTLGKEDSGRRERFDDFDIIIIDEAHHAAAKSYHHILEHYGFPCHEKAVVPPGKLLLGVTATPQRSDKVGLDHVFDRVVYNRSLRDMIDDGYLVDIVPYRLTTNDTLDGIKLRGGDFAEGELAERLNNENRNQLIVNGWMQHAKDKKTIVFCIDVKHTTDVCDLFRNAGVEAEMVVGSTPDDMRTAILRRYEAGVTKVLVGCMVFCLDECTEILTSEGWVGIDDMTYDHKVANWDNGIIYFNKPKWILRRERVEAERMVSVKTPRMDIRISEGHNVLHRPRPYEGEFVKNRAVNVVDTALDIPITGDASPFLFSTVTPAKEHKRTGLSYKNPDNLSLDECRFIGFWVGDGSVNKPKSGGVEYTVSQSMRYKNIIDWFDGLTLRLGYDVKRKQRVYGGCAQIRWSFSRGTGGKNQVRKGLFEIEQYLSKDANSLLYGLSREQFLAFIEGFWYADGNRGYAEEVAESKIISNSNKNLLDLLQAIAVCRGCRATITQETSPRKKHHKQVYKLFINPDKRTHQIAKEIPLTIESEWKEERVWCVTSHSGNIVTRRNGYVSVTGNTEGFDDPGTECILMARPTKSQLVYIQQLGRGMRPFVDLTGLDRPQRLKALADSNKPNMILLDVVDNCTKNSPVMLPTLFGLHKDILMHGKKVNETAREIEKIQDEFPSFRASKVKDVSKLEEMKVEAQKLDPWSAIELPEEVAQFSKLEWFYYDHDYRIHVNDFETIILRQNILDQWDAVVRATHEYQETVNEANGEVTSGWVKLAEPKEETLGTAPSVDKAFTRTDKWIEENYPDQVNLLRQKASWHDHPASDKQINFLRKHLRSAIREDATGVYWYNGKENVFLTKHLAKKLMSQKFYEWKRKRPAGVS